jgi:hypothetical protein
MTWLEWLVGAVKLLVLVIGWFKERDQRKRELRKAAWKKLSAGLSERDVGKITAAWDRARRI